MSDDMTRLLCGNFLLLSVVSGPKLCGVDCFCFGFFLDQAPSDILLLTDHCFVRQPLTDLTDLCCQTESVGGGTKKVRRVLFPAVPCLAKHCFGLHK
jgi:hypothetical protein